MKRFMCLGVGVSVVAFVTATAAAQAPSEDAQKAKTVSITGCLAAGADAKSFTLNDAIPAAADKEQSKEAPKSSEMKSYRVTAGESSLNLANHVGHVELLLQGEDRVPVDVRLEGAHADSVGSPLLIPVSPR